MHFCISPTCNWETMVTWNVCKTFFETLWTPLWKQRFRMPLGTKNVLAAYTVALLYWCFSFLVFFFLFLQYLCFLDVVFLWCFVPPGVFLCWCFSSDVSCLLVCCLCWRFSLMLFLLFLCWCFSLLIDWSVDWLWWMTIDEWWLMIRDWWMKNDEW